jgi:hypothetical protein
MSCAEIHIGLFFQQLKGLPALCHSACEFKFCYNKMYIVEGVLYFYWFGMIEEALKYRWNIIG